MAAQTFTTEGYDLYFETTGQPDHPPILMVHGYTMSAHMWHTTVSALEQHLYCVRLDLLGHGRSPVDPQGDHSIDAQGRRVLALADHLGLERFYLIGHSMGGQICLNIAARLAPDRVIKLVDVDGVASGKLADKTWQTVAVPLFRMRGSPFVPLMAAFLRVASVDLKPVARWQYGAWWHDFEARDFDWWREDRVLNLRPGIHHTWYLSLDAFLNTDLTADLASISCPTLVIFGAEDEVVPVSEGRLVAEHVPDCRLEIIPDCGHFPMYERTKQYLTVLKPFLSG